MNKTIRIEWNYGKSYMELDIAYFLPAAAADMNRLIDTLLIDYNEAIANQINDYIGEQVRDLAVQRGNLDEQRQQQKIAKINRTIKKYISNSAALAKRFDVVPVEDVKVSAIPTLKKATVESLGKDNGENIIRTFEGVTFNYRGVQFDAYQPRKGAAWEILINGTGCGIATAAKKNQIIAALTEKVFDFMNTEHGKKNIAAARDLFNKVKGTEPEPETAPAAVETTPAAAANDTTSEPEKEYKYFMKYRPAAPGAQPAGMDHFDDLDKKTTGYYSAIYYKRALTESEVSNYELTPADDTTPAAAENTTEGEKTMNTEEKKEITTAAATETTTPAATAPEEIDLNAVNAANLADYLPALLMGLANDKHNTSIILAAGIEAGVIPPAAILDYFTTGAMPAVHTFDAWKQAGYTVKKGSHAAFTARIWKYTEKKAGTYTEEEAASINGMMVNADGTDMVNAGDEKISHNFIRKLAFFFTAEQVEKTPERAPLPELPADVKQETRRGCEWISGNTRPIKESLKAAGFRWSKKQAAWYRKAA